MGEYDFDIIVIGGGPGGYVAAIRASQLGAKVCLVEKARIGGTCLNWGCIPTKALYRSAEVYELIKRSGEFGIDSGSAAVNWEQVQSRKRKIVDQLKGGILQLMKANNITVVEGEANFIDAHSISVIREDGSSDTISSGHMIIATGSLPSVPPIEGADLPGVVDSTGLLEMDHIPERLVIVGGGVIGIEFASVFNAFGSKVTVVEFLPGILSQMDSDITKRLALMLKKKGIEIYTDSKVTKIEKQDALRLTISTKKGEIQIDGDTVLMAVGRQPNVRGLMLENACIAYDRKGIVTNIYGQTSVPNIYAAGDVTGGIMLAHTASHQGVRAVEHIMGCLKSENMDVVPGCVFTFPEVSSAGITQEEAAAKGIAVKIGKFLFGANGKALTLGEGEGLIKVISDENGILIGVHILGPHASDLIHEGVLAIGMKLSAKDIIDTIHAHPTLSETFSEAVMGLEGISIHSAPVKRINNK